MKFILLSSLFIGTANADSIFFTLAASSPAVTVPIGPSSNIMSRMSDPYTCETYPYDETECTCSVVEEFGVEYIALDCGFCTTCGPTDRTVPAMDICIRKKHDFMTPTSRDTIIKEVTAKTVGFSIPDRCEIAFEWLKIEYTDDKIVIPRFAVNGMDCDVDISPVTEIDTVVGTSCLVDCTAHPHIDEVVDICQGGWDNIYPFSLFLAEDPTTFDRQCLDAKSSVETAGTSGDPHLETLDGLEYDCHASGEFVLVTSSDNSLEIQGRFEEPAGASGQTSVMTGLAIEYEGSTFEIVLEDHTDTGNCAAIYNEVNLPASEYYNKRLSVVVEETDDTFTITWGEEFLQVSLERHSSANFGCYWSANVALPVKEGVEYRGLFGSPDGDATNDWMQPDGTVVSQPADADELRYETAYNYCTANWCITEEADSLFAHGTGEFAALNKCDVPYNSNIESLVAGASADIAKHCEGNERCVIDASLGDLVDGEGALQDRSAFYQFNFDTESVAKHPFDAATEAAAGWIICGAPSKETSSCRGLFCGVC